MSSEDYDGLKAIRAARREMKRRVGVPCARCVELYPKRSPSILLPMQTCRWCGYTDDRAKIPQEAWDAVYAEFGLIRK